ncbi:MAG TPA: hypothetical protein VFG76_06090 [Candidatus Polarisedimenticolia bacterium]|nr:hypothetical protein [Candidatus Polarisedimenticolia bacterium]
MNETSEKTPQEPSATAVAPGGANEIAPPSFVVAPRPADSFFPQPDLIGPDVRAFLGDRVRQGDPVTIEIGKTSFTGRIFRTMLEEGWIALEHVDGRRKAFMIIEGGKIKTQAGAEIQLPALSGK